MLKRGVSLIVLVITIIVLAILATVIIVSLNNTGVISRSNEAVFRSNVNSYKTELSLYIADQFIADPTYTSTSLNASSSTNPSITTIIPSMTTEDSAKFEVSSGELVYVGNDADELGWAQDMGIVE